MEQNILNLDPAKGFWPNMDLDHPDPGLFNQFRKKKLITILENFFFFFLSKFLKTKYNMSPKEIFNKFSI